METVTVSQFMQDLGITAIITRINSRPDGLMDGMANHWKVMFHCDKTKRYLTVFFSGGSAVTAIKPEDVLSNLANDAYSVETKETFEEFASEFGYDVASRNAEKIYKACKHQTNRLKKFLCVDAMAVPYFYYRTLLNADQL